MLGEEERFKREQRVYRCIRTAAEEERPAPSNEQIRRSCNFGCVATVQRYIKDLVASNQLVVEKQKTGGNRRRFAFPDGKRTGWTGGGARAKQYRVKPTKASNDLVEQIRKNNPGLLVWADGNRIRSRSLNGLPRVGA